VYTDRPRVVREALGNPRSQAAPDRGHRDAGDLSTGGTGRRGGCDPRPAS
jgi:hypothetical protein